MGKFDLPATPPEGNGTKGRVREGKRSQQNTITVTFLSKAVASRKGVIFISSIGLLVGLSSPQCAREITDLAPPPPPVPENNVSRGAMTLE